MASIPSFIFGGDSKYKTQEELEAAREQVRAMLGDIGQSGLTGWGGVMADLGKGIAARVEKGRIDKGQEGLLAEQAKLSEMFGFGGGGGGAGTDVLAGGGAQDAFFANPGGGIDTGANAKAVNLSGSRADFVAALMPAAIEHGARIGVDPRIIVAQAAQETGWGKHAPGNNYFGIKSHGKGGGKTLSTEEVINGKRVRINDSFRQFGSPADSVAGYADFLATNKRYGPMRSAQGLDAQLRALGASGYATDPNYAASVGAIARSLPLSGGGQISGGGGSNAQAGGGAGDSFLQAKPFDLHNRFRITPAMLGPDEEPAPAPPPAAVPPAPAPVPVRNVPVNDAGLRTPAGVDFLSRMGNPAPMSGGPRPLPMVPGMNGPMPPPLPPQAQTPAPAPPQPVPAPPAPPAPPPQVDPFTSMILGDKAAQFKPGNYIPPAPVGKQVFPAAPPAPGTPAAAGFGVPPVVGGGGADQLAGKGTFPPAPAPPQAQQAGGGDKIAKLQFILSSPYASKEQKLMAGSMIEREYALEDERRKAAAEAADPLNKLKLEQAQLEVEKLRKGDTPALINAGDGRLYNPATGEWITAPAAAGGGGPFSGDGVEAQALNGMVTSGRISVQQAYDLAAGKVITDPATGAMIFMSGAELVGALPGQPPQVIQPAPQPTPAPAGSPQPAPQAPATTTAPPAAQAPAGTPGRPLTSGKPGKLATEAETRARALYAVASPEMKTVETMFPALSDVNDQVISKLPWGTSNWATSEAYQRGKNALMTIIQSYMYVTSGASAPDAEVERNAISLMPQLGEKPGTIKDKLARIQNYVRAIKMAGGQAEETAPAGGGGNTDYKTIYGLE